MQMFYLVKQKFKCPARICSFIFGSLCTLNRVEILRIMLIFVSEQIFDFPSFWSVWSFIVLSAAVCDNFSVLVYVV